MTNPKPIRNYPFRGKIYTAKQIDEILNGTVLTDYYTKDETDTAIETAISDCYTKEETDTAIATAISSVELKEWIALSKEELTEIYDNNHLPKNDYLVFIYANSVPCYFLLLKGFANEIKVSDVNYSVYNTESSFSTKELYVTTNNSTTPMSIYTMIDKFINSATGNNKPFYTNKVISFSPISGGTYDKCMKMDIHANSTGNTLDYKSSDAITNNYVLVYRRKNNDD